MSLPFLRNHSEDAPLLRDPDAEDAGALNGGRPRKRTFAEHIDAMTREPLTILAKLLLVVALLLLLLAAVFIGLFAGAEHKLRHGGSGSGRSTATATATATATRISTVIDTSTLVSTSTVAGTTTVVGTSILTSISTTTTTKVQTTTVPSVPAPTGGPDTV